MPSADDRSHLDGAELALDPEAIRGAIAEEGQGAWAAVDEVTVEARIARLVEDVALIEGLDVRHVDWRSYGQGFSSAVPVVVSRADADDAAFRASGRFGDFEGVVIALCRLAPLACVGQPSGERLGHEGMLGQGEFLAGRHTAWAEPLARIDATLMRHDFVRLPAEVLNRRIDPTLRIDTNFGRPPFTVFDAWFHWWD